MKKYLIFYYLLAFNAFAQNPLGEVKACSADGLKQMHPSLNLIENGSFEDPLLAEGSWEVFSHINGWVGIAGPGIEIQNHAAGTPFDGEQYVELDSHANSVMEQTVAVEPNKHYCLKFAYSPRPGLALASAGIRVWINHKAVKLVKSSGDGLSDTQWKLIYIDWRSPRSEAQASVRFEAIGISDSLGGYVNAVEMYELGTMRR
jgi:hypothetical protein